MPDFRQQQTDNTYELCQKYIKKFKYAIDIGCDVFQFAGKLANDFEHIHCFDFRNKEKQMNSFVSNPDKITFYHTGLGEIKDMRYTKPGVGRIKSDVPHGNSTTKVPINTLDSFGLFEGIDFIKMDVEGYEPKVILGGMQTIEKNNPVILCEINRGDFTAKDLLENIGYKCVDIYYKLGQPHDYLFVR